MIQTIKMVTSNTYKQLGSGLIPTLIENLCIKNGFNHLSLQTQSSSPSPYYFVHLLGARNTNHYLSKCLNPRKTVVG